MFLFREFFRIVTFNSLNFITIQRPDINPREIQIQPCLPIIFDIRRVNTSLHFHFQDQFVIYPKLLIQCVSSYLLFKVLNNWVYQFTFYMYKYIWARDLKNSGKYGSGLSCRWALFTAWAFGFKLHLTFQRVGFKKPV